MNKASETNNDILNRLRENVEKQSADSEAKQPEQQSRRESPEQLLDLLKRQLGDKTGAKVEEPSSEEDYDISGFEIETEEEPVTVLEEDSADERVSDSSDTEDIPVDEAEDLPWVTDDETDNAKENEASVLATEQVLTPIDVDEPSSEESEVPSLVEAEEDVTDEFDESLSEKDSADNQEAVRKQIELFVEKSVEPEEEFDYFAELERRSAKSKATSESVEETSEEVTETEAKDAVTEQEVTSPVYTAESFEGVSEADNEEITTTVSDPEMEKFFFGKTDDETEDSKTEPEGTAHPLDDTDINLLLAMGKKQAIEEAVGFVRVREAKNNFYDITDDESVGTRVFAYDGEEYRTSTQTNIIKTRYRKERKRLWWRFSGTLLFVLLLLAVEYLPLVNFTVPYISAFLASAFRCRLVALAGVALVMMLSLKQIFDGVKGFFALRANRYTPLAIMAILNLLYDVSAVWFFVETDLILYNFVIAVFFLVSIIGDNIRLSKEILTFDIVSSDKEKFSLEKTELSPAFCRDEKVLRPRDLLVEKVSFVGKYFKRTAKRPVAYTEYFVELLVTLIAAIFVAIGMAILYKDAAFAINSFMVVIVVCMPMQHMIGNYPFGKLAKTLYRHESAIIGETADKEYVGANTVYLDDSEVFGDHGISVSGLRTYNDANFYDVLYHALAVFSRVEGPLRHVFDNSAHEIEPAESVKILNIHVDGIEALVDASQNVLIGNNTFMRNNGLSPKYNEDDERRVESGDFCILYMSVNGVLVAKFYMKYTVTKRFETFVSEMKENGTGVGIRTLDPNVTEQMLSRVRRNHDTTISVIRPTLNDLVPVGRRSDSSIITAKNSHIFSRILTLCGRLKRVNSVCSVLRIISMLVGFSAVLSVLLLGKLIWMPALAVVIYHVLWLIPSLIYTGKKLK